MAVLDTLKQGPKVLTSQYICHVTLPSSGGGNQSGRKAAFCCCIA